MQNIAIQTEYIKLDSFLKLACVASTGGEGKIMIQQGDVFVNGEICTQRGKKLRSGDVVKISGEKDEFVVV